MPTTYKKFFCAALLLLTQAIHSSEKGGYEHNTSTVSQEELVDYAKSSKNVRKLIDIALELAGEKLGYLYGSADPKNKGMDCSGTLYYIMTHYGLKEIPRSSHDLYQWVLNKGVFYKIASDKLSTCCPQLKPGDLLFWNGTYKTARKVTATHVMIYLGKNKEGLPLMIGASDGRTYQGKKVYGVSVFDLVIPRDDKKFLGYSCIPGINC